MEYGPLFSIWRAPLAIDVDPWGSHIFQKVHYQHHLGRSIDAQCRTLGIDTLEIRIDKISVRKINEFAVQVLYSGVVLPALMEAVEKILDQDEEFADKRWYQIVEKLIREKGDAGILITSQRILNNPVNNSFNTIVKLLDYDA